MHDIEWKKCESDLFSSYGLETHEKRQIKVGHVTLKYFSSLIKIKKQDSWIIRYLNHRCLIEGYTAT